MYTRSAVLYIVIPAYNEVENIRRVVAEWYSVVEEHAGDGMSRLVVIDDGSTDDTYSVLSAMAAELPLLKVLTKKNGGHGSAVLFGYRYAIEHGADWIFQTDSDGQTDAAEFDSFWNSVMRDGSGDPTYVIDKSRNARPDYSFAQQPVAVFGNRTERQDGKGRVFVEKTLTRILRSMFRVKVPDANAPFRLMRADKVKQYLRLLPEDYNLPNVMLTTFFVYYGERVQFLPISFKPRQGGVNSINMKKIAGIGKKAISDFREIRANMPPR